MKISQLTGKAMLDALKTLCNGGTLVIYSGPQPSDPETALSGNTALATFDFGATAFGADSLSGSDEQTTASFANDTVTAGATGTAAFARAYESDGSTVINDFSVGTSGADINLNSTAITSGGNVTLSSFVLKMPVD